MGSGKLIRAAVRKYGIASFKKEIISVHETEKEMNEAEASLVEIGEHSYNLCPGGKGGWGYVNANCGNQGERLNKSLSNEKRSKGGSIRAQNEEGMRLMRVKALESWRGCKHSPEAKEKNRIAHLGTKMPDEHQRGEKNSQHGSFWITNGIDNKKCRGYIPEGWFRGRSLSGKTYPSHG